MRKTGVIGALLVPIMMQDIPVTKSEPEMETSTNRSFKISEYKTHNSVRDYKDGRANRRERRAKNRKK